MSLDLVVLVPDKHIEHAIRGLLDRPDSLGIGAISVQVLVHPNRDPGVASTGHLILRPFTSRCRYALSVLDHAWEGSPPTPAELCVAIENKLRPQWGDRGRCVCISPEVEVWIWSDSPHVGQALGWPSTEAVRTWLHDEGLWPADLPKPPDPKLAFERAIREKQVVPSSAIFANLAARVSLGRCRDPSFLTLRSILRDWFGSDSLLDR